MTAVDTHYLPVENEKPGFVAFCLERLSELQGGVVAALLDAFRSTSDILSPPSEDQKLFSFPFSPPIFKC